MAAEDNKPLKQIPVVHPEQYKIGAAQDDELSNFVILGFVKGTDEITFALPLDTAEEMAEALIAHVKMLRNPAIVPKNRVN